MTTSANQEAGVSGRGPGSRSAWGSFVTAFMIASVCAFALLLGTVLVAEPYDTGRVNLLKPRPREAISPRVDMASRGRDPSFNAVIIGNSHIAPIAPARLSEATGLSFVSLIAAGSLHGPQLVLLDWYLKHRRDPVRAVVLGVDEFWCLEAAPLGQAAPFPYFLFATNPWAYAVGLISHHSLEQAFARLVTPSKRHFRPRPRDGFWDLELDYTWTEPKVAASLAQGSSAFVNLSGRYPAMEQLERMLASAPGLAEAPVVLVRPPVWAASLSAPGTPQARSEEACRAAMAALAGRHANLRLIDWRDGRDANRQMRDFFDVSHYRAPLATKVEEEIVRDLRKRAGSS